MLTAEERTLAANVRRLMAENSWSIRKLAEVCELPHTTLQNFLEERSSPRVGTLCILARAFGVKVQELLPEPEAARTPSRRRKQAS